MPHTLILTDWIVHQMGNVFAKLRVFPERMKLNLDRTGGLVMAEPLLLALTAKGMDRQDAHEHVRRLALEAHDTGLTLKEVAVRNALVKKHLARKELDRVLDPAEYVGQAPAIVDRLAGHLSKLNGAK